MATNFYLDKRADKKGDFPIRVSIVIDSVRVVTSAGYNITASKWDDKRQKAKQGTSNAKGIAYNTINARLSAIEAHFNDYQNNCQATQTQVTAERIKEQLALATGKTKKHNNRRGTTFLDYFTQFIQECGTTNAWTDATYQKFNAVRKHLINFDKNVSFDKFTEKGLADYVTYLRTKIGMRNSTIGKQLGFIKWFLRWATAKGVNSNIAYTTFKPKLKGGSEKKVIFLTWDELMRVYNFDIPPSGSTVKLWDMQGKQYDKRVGNAGALERVRDVFCFCCFTSLRYSDVANLKRSDIKDGYIEITTIKTADSLKIELNKYSSAILDKYASTTLEGNKALPVISNQRMNDYLKDLCEICGINAPQTETYYVGNERFDDVHPKYELIGTHAGRRTFICNALALGIPAQVVMKWTGHSDYKAMKPYIDIADDIKATAMNKFNEI